MNKLTQILHNLVELHINLLEILNKKQQILIAGDNTSLLPILSEESKLIKKITDEDKHRLTALGEDAYKASLTQLIEQQPDTAEKQEWITIHAQLQTLFQKIAKVNESNQQLLQQSLTYTQYMIDRLLPTSAGTGTYNAGAASKETKESVRLFDAKA